MEKACATCGNHYDRSFRVIDADGREFWFDSFECAIQKVAPVCRHCGCKIIGHGVDDNNGVVFCCDHCRSMHSGSSS
jgi:hypothetical protein